MERLDIAQLNQQAGYATGLNSARSALNLLSEQSTASTRQLAEIIASDQITGGNEFALSAPVIGYRYELDSQRNFQDARGYTIDKMAEATAAGGEDAGVFAPLKKVQEALKEDPSLSQMFYISKDNAGGGDLHSGRHYGYLFTIERKPKTGEEYIAASAIEIKGTEEELQAIMNNLSGSRGTSTDAVLGFDSDAAFTVDAITDLILDSYHPDSPALKDENFGRRMTDYKEGGTERYQELQELRIEELTEFFERFLQSVPGEQIAEALEFIATYAGGISTALFELKTEDEKAALFRIVGEFFEQEQTGELWTADVGKEEITVPESNISLSYTADGAPIIKLKRSNEEHSAPVIYEFPLISSPRREHPLARTPEKKAAGSLIAKERPVGPYIEAAASKKIKTEKESDQFASLLAAAEELKRRAEEKAKLLAPALTLAEQKILPLSGNPISEKIPATGIVQELNAMVSAAASKKEESIKSSLSVSISTAAERIKLSNESNSLKTSLEEKTAIKQQIAGEQKLKDAVSSRNEKMTTSATPEALAQGRSEKVAIVSGAQMSAPRQKTVNTAPEIKADVLLEKQTSELILKHEQKLQQIIQSLVQKGISKDDVAAILKEKQIPATRIKALMEVPAKLTATSTFNGPGMESAITDIFIASGAGKITSSKAAVDLLKTSTSLESVLEKVESYPFRDTQLQSIKEKITTLYHEPERGAVTEIPYSGESIQSEIKIEAPSDSLNLQLKGDSQTQSITPTSAREVIVATLQEFDLSEVAAEEIARKLLSDSPALNKVPLNRIVERLEEYPLTEQQLEYLRERLSEAASEEPAALALVQEAKFESRLVEVLLESGENEQAASKIVKDILIEANSAEDVINKLKNYPVSDDTLENLKEIIIESYSEQETALQLYSDPARRSLIEALRGANVSEVVAETIASEILNEATGVEDILEQAGRYPFTEEQLSTLKDALTENYSDQNYALLQTGTARPEKILSNILEQIDSLPEASDKIASEILTGAHSVAEIVEKLKNYPFSEEVLIQLQNDIQAAADVLTLPKETENKADTVISSSDFAAREAVLQGLARSATEPAWGQSLSEKSVVSEIAKESVALLLKLLGFEKEEDLPEMVELLLSGMIRLPEAEPVFKLSNEKANNGKLIPSASDRDGLLTNPTSREDLELESALPQSDIREERGSSEDSVSGQLLFLRKNLLESSGIKVPTEAIKALVAEESVTAEDLKLIIAALKSSGSRNEAEVTPVEAKPENSNKTKHNPLNRKLGRMEREKILEFFMNQYSDLLAILSNDARKKLLESEYLFDFEARLYSLLKNTELSAEQKTAIIAALHAHDGSEDISDLLGIFASAISGFHLSDSYRPLTTG